MLNTNLKSNPIALLDLVNLKIRELLPSIDITADIAKFASQGCPIEDQTRYKEMVTVCKLRRFYHEEVERLRVLACPVAQEVGDVGDCSQCRMDPFHYTSQLEEAKAIFAVLNGIHEAYLG